MTRVICPERYDGFADAVVAVLGGLIQGLCLILVGNALRSVDDNLAELDEGPE